MPQLAQVMVAWNKKPDWDADRVEHDSGLVNHGSDKTCYKKGSSPEGRLDSPTTATVPRRMGAGHPFPFPRR
jgi:hypothetical protein